MSLLSKFGSQLIKVERCNSCCSAPALAGVRSPGAPTGAVLSVPVVAAVSAGGQSGVSSPLAPCRAPAGRREAQEQFCLPGGAQPDTIRSLNWCTGQLLLGHACCTKLKSNAVFVFA